MVGPICLKSLRTQRMFSDRDGGKKRRGDGSYLNTDKSLTGKGLSIFMIISISTPP